MRELVQFVCLCVGLLICPVYGSDTLRLTIDLCEEPIVGQPVRMCCKTEGLGMTGIRVQIPGSNHYPMGSVECRNYTYTYYKSSYNNRYDKTVQVQCYTRYDVTVYAFTLTRSLERDYRAWGCETYSDLKVSLTWSRSYSMRFTEYQGTVAALNNSDATLRFDIPSSYNKIYLYRKYTTSPITQWTNIYSILKVSSKYVIRREYRRVYVTIYNVTPNDVGTYWLSVDKGIYFKGVNISQSLVLFDTPSDIEIKPQDVSKHDSKVSATLYCDVTIDITSKNMLALFTNISHNWLYPITGSNYEVSRIRDESVRVTGIDCTIYNLAPIGCGANLIDGFNTSYYWYDVKDLCALPIMAASEVKTQTVQTVQTVPSTVSIVTLVILALLFLVVMGFLFTNRNYVCKSCKNPSPFERTRRWWRHRREDRHPFEELTSDEEQNQEVVRPNPNPSLSAQIHDRRRLDYTIQDQPTAPPSTGASEQQTNIQTPVYTIQPQGPVFQPYALPIVPSANGGYGQVPVTVSPTYANAGPGHILGGSQDTNRERTPFESLQHPALDNSPSVIPPVIPPVSEFSSSFSYNRNEQFAAEANLQLETLHRSLQDETILIEVTRDGIVDDLINFYTTMDQSDAKNTVYCKFNGEEGLDAGGVTRDVFTVFWQKAIPKYFTGNIALVPQLSLQTYDISTFVTLGRIFAHSTAILKAIPIQMCRSTLNVVIFGEMEMVSDSEDIVIDDFLLYVDSNDRRLLDKALANFDNLDQDERNMLRNIFVNYDMPEIPRKENFKRNLSSIAHNELCIKPKVVCDQMGKGIPEVHRQLFWGQMTILHIDGLYETFRPTPQTVVDKLKCLKWPLGLNSPELKTFNNLKIFVSNMSTETLLRFLHFVTGERKVPNSDINIEFTNATGVSRRPIAHTCSHQLELPKSYTNYEELRRDFMTILESDEAFVLNQL